MASQPHNPFVLPGFGASGDPAQNPMMASMEMMRQAWQGLATAGGLDHSALTPLMSVEDLDKRISDLRAVENWLRMNMSMLSSTIQGLEVQRATITTLKSFVNQPMASAAGAAASGVSPLEAVLGIKSATAQPADPEPSQPSASASGSSKADDAAQADPASAAQASGMAAAQGWWDMLQKQFDTLAAATTATLQSAESARAAAAPPSGNAASRSTFTATPRKAAKKAAARSAGGSRSAKKTATKTVASKRTRTAKQAANK